MNINNEIVQSRSETNIKYFTGLHLQNTNGFYGLPGFSKKCHKNPKLVRSKDSFIRHIHGHQQAQNDYIGHDQILAFLLYLHWMNVFE